MPESLRWDRTLYVAMCCIVGTLVAIPAFFAGTLYCLAYKPAKARYDKAGRITKATTNIILVLVGIPILWAIATAGGLLLADLLGFIPAPFDFVLVVSVLGTSALVGLRRKKWQIYVPAVMLIGVAIQAASGH